MCAVIGAKIFYPNEDDIQSLESLFLESKIRGLHATGVSYAKDGKIHTIKEAIPADQFIKKYNFRDMIEKDEYGERLILIGHCRYSTSDLEWNQPIAHEKFAIVHNGVITQELPENWEARYGLKPEGKNDTELLFLSTQDAYEGLTKNPFVLWPNSSMSVIQLNYTHMPWISFYRNGKRPLWYAYQECSKEEEISKRPYPNNQAPTNGYVFSTEDIVKRAFKDAPRKPHYWQKTKPNHYYAYHYYYNSWNPFPEERFYVTKGRPIDPDTFGPKAMPVEEWQ